MGYDLHVTRACHWLENAGSQITAGEWLDLVATDPELHLDASNGPYAVLWVPTGSRKRGWFDWYDGNVYTTDPDRPTVKKMLALAGTLAALVQGDDGEIYETARDWNGSG